MDHGTAFFIDQANDQTDEAIDSAITPMAEGHLPASSEDRTDDPAKAEGENTGAQPADIGSTPVTVDIYDQSYHLRGQDPAYIKQLALIVDGKMRAVAAGGTTVDSLRVAVLAALNIADHLVRVEAQNRALSGSLRESESTLRHRTENLSGLLDSILTEDRKIG